MSTAIPQRPCATIEYPDSDGQPIAENTLQFQWIVTIKENLEALFRRQPDVFVAGDLLWYPVEGHPEICTAPDALIVFGRPKGHRGSYMQWVEGDIASHVVFEVLAPGNRAGEMEQKRLFYQKYGVQEYYIVDPDEQELQGWRRSGSGLVAIPATELSGYVSPLLGIRFEPGEGDLRILYPDGSPFLTTAELFEQWKEAKRQLAEAERQLAEAERQLAEAERQLAEAERQLAERLAAPLRELGLDAD